MTAVPEHIIDAALHAAFPSLPDGMSVEDARRRITKALRVAQPGILREAASRVHDFGRETGDAQTAGAYARVVTEVRVPAVVAAPR